MTLSVLPDDLLKEIHNNTMVLPPGVMYFRRLDAPTIHSIEYATGYLVEEGIQNDTNLLVWDIRNKPQLSGGLQLTIVRQIPRLKGHFEHVAVVWDETQANLWKTEFITRMPVFKQHVGFSFHFTMEEAVLELSKMVDSRAG